jgi:hypothetical protein
VACGSSPGRLRRCIGRQDCFCPAIGGACLLLDAYARNSSIGISDWFRSPSTLSRPDDLRAALVDAFEREDYERVTHLINDHSDRIRSEFRYCMRRGDAATTARTG